MVCGLAWRCCIKRWVKKRCKSGAKVVGVIMVDPPSDARAGAWLLASAPESCLNTIACPRRGSEKEQRQKKRLFETVQNGKQLTLRESQGEEIRLTQVCKGA